MWKFLAESVSGVSHECAGLPCQDHSSGELMRAGGETVLVLVCADGAGSAEHADVGAKIACEGMLNELRGALGGGLRLSDVREELLRDWHRRVRKQLQEEADRRSARVRDFACTLLTAVVGEQAALFSQIGDGAIVFGEDGGYRTVFRPQSGEYVNTTNFLTGEDFESRMEFRVHTRRVDNLALFTDGLQMLALRYADGSVHAPFFDPMFGALRAAESASDLQGPCRDFLNSTAVNRRTDDDKTLILATRRLPDDAAQPVRQPESPG